MSKAKPDELFIPGQYFKPPVRRICKPPRPLTEAEKIKVEANREMVRTHMPELVPMLKELSDLGMVDGWRSVGEVVLLSESPSTTQGERIKQRGSEHGNA